jgi:AraC-like DNA-binding protein
LCCTAKAVAPARAPLPSMTDRLSVTGCGPTSSMHTVLLPPINATHSAGERLAALFRRDLLRGWKVGEVSRALAMSQRSLQRTLHDEGTTFTEVLKRTRVECAQTLLEDFRLSLTDIAFCIGFADQSHFTRTFRSFYDVPRRRFATYSLRIARRPKIQHHSLRNTLSAVFRIMRPIGRLVYITFLRISGTEMRNAGLSLLIYHQGKLHQ